jgi:hypothetical protein
MGATVAIILAKERHVADAFLRAGATSPERAVVPEDISVDLGGMVGRRLLRQAVLRPATPGRFYLDEPTWHALRSTRRRIGIALLVAIGLAALYFVTVAGGHSMSSVR